MTKKIAISLPDTTLRTARRAVKSGKAANVSNYIATLIDRESATESFQAMIADWLRECGATKAEIRAARLEARRDFERAGLLMKAGSHATPRKTA